MEGLAFVTIAGAAFVPIFVLMFFWMLIPGKSSSDEPGDLQMPSQEERAPSGGRSDLTDKLKELTEARPITGSGVHIGRTYKSIHCIGFHNGAGHCDAIE